MTLDHLVYAAPDLEDAVDRIEALLGVVAELGGRHPGVGTRNAIVSFGGRTYLEVVGPDPGQPDPPGPRWFGIDHLDEPRLVTWCARATDLDGLAAQARREGVELGEVRDGGRVRPDGSELRWRVTAPSAQRCGGVVPFLIDWMGSPHPGAGPGQGCRVEGLRARHPEAEAVARRLQALGCDLPVEPGPAPRLEASIRTPSGIVSLA